MKRLTYISGTNIRGFDFEYPLKPVTVFCGQNESGKTAALDAIRIALLGYLPRLGKQNEATMKLASQQQVNLSVNLLITDGDATLPNTRTWRRQPNGDLKKIEVCEIKDIPEVLFDLRAWLGLTQKKRIEMIFERLGKTEIRIDEGEILSKLLKIEVLPIDEGKAAVNDLGTFVNKSLAGARRSKQSGLDWLTALVKELDDEKKSYAVTQERLSGQVVALRPATIPKTVKPQIDQIAKELKTVCARIAELEAARQAIGRGQARHKELEATIALPVPTAKEIKELEFKIAQLKAKVDGFRSDVPELEKQRDSKAREYTNQKTKLDMAMALTAKLKDQIIQIDQLPGCPTCKSKKKGWQEEWLAKLTEELAISEKAEATLHESLETTRKHGKVLSDKLEAARKTAQAASETAKMHSDMVETLENLVACQEEVKKAIAELKQMTEITGRFDQSELEQLQKKADSLQIQKDELLKQQSEFDRSEADRAKSATIEKQLIAAQTRVEVFKRASTAIVLEQEAILGHAFKSILVDARRFTDDILLGPLDYRSGELGMETEKGWVSHETFSGRGQALAYVGLSIALAQASPVKIVILDEAGIFDKPTKIKVVERLLALAKEGFIDGAYLADPDAEDYASIKHEDIELIELGR